MLPNPLLIRNYSPINNEEIVFSLFFHYLEDAQPILIAMATYLNANFNRGARAQAA